MSYINTIYYIIVTNNITNQKFIIFRFISGFLFYSTYNIRSIYTFIYRFTKDKFKSIKPYSILLIVLIPVILSIPGAVESRYCFPAFVLFMIILIYNKEVLLNISLYIIILLKYYDNLINTII